MFSFALTLFLAQAATPAGTARQFEPHVHGVAQLAIGLDGSMLIAELETPLVNLVGFEHAPETAEQQRAWREALDWLSEPANVFEFAGGDCAPAGVEIAAPGFADDHDHGHDGHDHDHAHNDDAHAHADLRAAYMFECAEPERLSAIGVRLFDRFAGFETIDAVFLGDRTVSGKLTPQRASLRPR